MGIILRMKVVLALLGCLVAPTLSKTVGSIQVKDYGEVWVIAPDWAAGAINMPGNNAGDGDYYCDANLGNNIWCPEYDTMEGNKYTIATSLHTCNGGNGYWDSCDRGGCQVNAFNVDSSMMCPEDRCKVNTNRPFVISHFQNSQQANTWMGQEGRDASFNIESI